MSTGNNTRQARDHDFSEEFGASAQPEDVMSLEDLYNVKLEVSADLGNCSMRVREVLELKEGSLLTMDKMAGEMADIYVNGILLARGEIVVLVDSLHIRVSEIVGNNERQTFG